MLLIRYVQKSVNGHRTTAPISEWTKQLSLGWKNHLSIDGLSFYDWITGLREDGDVWESTTERYEAIWDPFYNINLGQVGR